MVVTTSSCTISSLAPLSTLAERYLGIGKTLHLVHLSEECRKLLRKTCSLVEVNVIEAPRYFVADDVLG
jgi:SulP family sulfate permease